MTTRLALDRLRAARARCEVYVGPWLPEPLVTDPETPETKVIEAERLSLALLGALERLNPVERAALVLRDVFDLEYAELFWPPRSPATSTRFAICSPRMP